LFSKAAKQKRKRRKKKKQITSKEKNIEWKLYTSFSIIFFLLLFFFISFFGTQLTLRHVKHADSVCKGFENKMKWTKKKLFPFQVSFSMLLACLHLKVSFYSSINNADEFLVLATLYRNQRRRRRMCIKYITKQLSFNFANCIGSRCFIWMSV
jgi:ABC-type polysaccharide transport system permease subunit